MAWKKPQDDGDFHYRLKLAPGQRKDLVNSKNIDWQLVFEPICVHHVTSPQDAKVECRKFHQRFQLPNKGDRVTVTGELMLDTKHGWLEIHP